MVGGDTIRTDLIKGSPTGWARAGEPNEFPKSGPAGLAAVLDAAARWRRFAPLLARLFAAEIPTGVIESPLAAIPRLVVRHAHARAPLLLSQRVFLKADHALPLGGSIKARGGLYAVLCIAERAALSAGLLRPGDDYASLAGAQARECFAAKRISVGSTGNLGIAVGLAARALGFQAEVHMSHDAKEWKKARLRAIGVSVVEHRADYTSAVSAARDLADALPEAHFIDDERSTDLFHGYAAGAPHLAQQLLERGVNISAEHPLCVHLPCGVGGAPGGVLFGLRAVLGAHVWGFFAEPTASPCMLMRLLGYPASASVYDLGLDNQTAADGLAVARASDFAFEQVGAQVMGAYTLTDAQMFSWLAAAHVEESLRLEPAAAAGFGALDILWRHPAFAPLRTRLAGATHIIWTTGGATLPDPEFAALLARAHSPP